MSPISSTLANASAYGYRTLAAAGGTAYESIASASGDGSSSIITFSSLPSNYYALQLRVSCKGTRSFQYEALYVRLNGDTGSNYANHYLYASSGGNVTPVGAASQTFVLVGQMAAANITGTVMTGAVIDVHDYASTSRNKTVRGVTGFDSNLSGSESSFLYLSSGLWMNTNAVTSISFLSNGAFTSDTRFALYGIKGA